MSREPSTDAISPVWLSIWTSAPLTSEDRSISTLAPWQDALTRLARHDLVFNREGSPGVGGYLPPELISGLR